MIGSLIRGIAGPVIESVAGIFAKREDRKLAGVTATGKLAQAKADNAHELAMTRAEWEAAMARASGASWKDEFWTIVLAAPFIMLIIGTLGVVFIGDDRILVAARDTIKAFEEVGLDYGYVLYIAIGAAFAVRIGRR